MNNESPIQKLKNILEKQKLNIAIKRNELLEKQAEVNNLQKNLDETQAQIQILEDKVEVGDTFVYTREDSFFKGNKLLLTKDDNGIFRLAILDGTEAGHFWTSGTKNINLVFGLQDRSYFKKF